MSGRLSISVDIGWQPHVLSGGSLAFWLAFVFRLQQFCLPHRLQRLCTGRSATQHGPLYREERHSTQSFVQGGAPLSTVLSSVFPGVGVDAFTGIFILSLKRFFYPPCERLLSCELHGLPIVTWTAPGWCGCWVGLLEQGPQCPGSCPAS